MRKKIKYMNKSIPSSSSIKYLGIYISDNLKWNDHVEYLELKNNKLIKLVKIIEAQSRGINYEIKTIIYKQIYLPNILYSYINWFKYLTSKQKKKLSNLQRTFMLACTGAFGSTNNIKLLNLLGWLEIKKEVEYMNTIKNGDLDNNTIRNGLLIQQSMRDNSTYEVPFDNNLIRTIKNKEILWCLTGHGPFLANFNKEERCRFCGMFEESGFHLVNNCLAFERGDLSIIENYESISMKIIKRIFKLGH